MTSQRSANGANRLTSAFGLAGEVLFSFFRSCLQFHKLKTAVIAASNRLLSNYSNEHLKDPKRIH